MGAFRTPLPRDRALLLLFIIAACLIVNASAFFLIPRFGGAPFLAVTLIVLLLLVHWHARAHGYSCPDCGKQFQIGFFHDLLSPHGLDSKYVKCPRCGKRVWARVLVRGGMNE